MKHTVIDECIFRNAAERMIKNYIGGTEIIEITEWLMRIKAVTADGREFSVEQSRRSGFAQKDISNYLYMKELVNGKWIRIKTRK